MECENRKPCTLIGRIEEQCKWNGGGKNTTHEMQFWKTIRMSAFIAKSLECKIKEVLKLRKSFVVTRGAFCATLVLLPKEGYTCFYHNPVRIHSMNIWGREYYGYNFFR